MENTNTNTNLDLLTAKEAFEITSKCNQTSTFKLTEVITDSIKSAAEAGLFEAQYFINADECSYIDSKLLLKTLENLGYQVYDNNAHSYDKDLDLSISWKHANFTT